MPQFQGKIANGKLFISDRAAFDAWQKKARQGEVIIQIKRKGEKLRSLAENNYYWGAIVQPIAEYTGYTSDEIHEFLKTKFLMDEREWNIGGRAIQMHKVASTAGLSTHAFEDYLRSIREWASAELGLYLETPNEGMNIEQ